MYLLNRNQGLGKIINEFIKGYLNVYRRYHNVFLVNEEIIGCLDFKITIKSIGKLKISIYDIKYGDSFKRDISITPASRKLKKLVDKDFLDLINFYSKEIEESLINKYFKGARFSKKLLNRLKGL